MRPIRTVMALVALALLGGCSVTTLRGAAIESVVAAPADQPAERIAADFAAPVGERIEATVWFEGLPAGSFVMEARSACTLDDAVVHPIVTASDNGGLLGMVDAGANVASWIDAQGMPRRVTSKLRMPLERKHYVVDFNHGSYHSRYKRSGGGGDRVTDKHYTLPRGEPVHDVSSMVLALRGWSPEPGTHGYSYLVMGTRLWKADFVYLGPETLHLPEGDRKAVRIEGVARKLARKSHRPIKDAAPRVISLWLSDDERRIPLRAVAQSKKYATKIQLSGYSAGSGKADVSPAPCSL